MIRNLLLDLDNTLLDFSMAERIALTKALTAVGVEPAPAVLSRYSELNDEQWRLLEQGKLTRPEVKVRRFRLLFEELGLDAPVERAAELYEKLLGVGHYYIDGAAELLEAAYGKYSLYLITNGTADVQHSRLKSADMEKYFDGIFISEEIGFDKPGRDYFDWCTAHIPDFCREEALVVGDSLTSDIQGGINAGIRTVWFNPKRKENNFSIVPDYEIHALAELLPLVETL